MSFDTQALQETLDEIMFQLAELKRQKAMMIRPGTVTSFDVGTNKAVVDIGFTTHEIDLGTHVGHWNPLIKGQQITLLCPDGDLSNGVLIHGGYCAGFTAPSTRTDEQVLVPPVAGGDDKAALRIRKGGMIRAEVKSRLSLKFYFADEDQTYALLPAALIPVPKDDA